MNIDIETLLNQQGVEFQSHQAGWINIRCGFCSDEGFHLGINVGVPKPYGNCWRCGYHSLWEIMTHMFNYSPQEASNADVIGRVRYIKAKKTTKLKKRLVPVGGDLSEQERAYLMRRGFDPEFLVYKYGIRGGILAGTWAYRVIIPIRFRDKEIGWTSRAIGDVKPKYLLLDKEKCLISPKEVLYNINNAKHSTVVVVEGPTDVWRMGDGFVCSLGTSMTQAQIKLLAAYDKVVFLFDPESDAQLLAEEYAIRLAALGVDTEVVDMETDCDPGDLSPEDANYVRRWLGL